MKESEEYKKRIDEYQKHQTIIRKPEPEYNPKEMETGMPMGCWFWIAALIGFALAALTGLLF